MESEAFLDIVKDFNDILNFFCVTTWNRTYVRSIRALVEVEFKEVSSDGVSGELLTFEFWVNSVTVFVPAAFNCNLIPSRLQMESVLGLFSHWEG